jgi:hypothetical protein
VQSAELALSTVCAPCISQDSTVLWETLPVYVMDVVIKIHHATMRKELLAHQG